MSTYTRPDNFGFIAPNGMTLTRSAKTATSHLNRVIRFVLDFTHREGRNPTKADILNGVFGWTNGRKSKAYNGRLYELGARGWNANFFRTAVHNGFLRHYRDGNTVRWSVGRRVIASSWFDGTKYFLDCTLEN